MVNVHSMVHAATGVTAPHRSQKPHKHASRAMAMNASDLETLSVTLMWQAPIDTGSCSRGRGIM
jgi:hypothetical protein